MLLICFKRFKQKLVIVHGVNNHLRLKEHVLIFMGHCVYSKKKQLACDYCQIWIKLECVLNVRIPNTPIRYTEFCTASWYHMHVTSPHHWGFPGVPVPTQHNLSMAMRGCRAKPKHSTYSTFTMLARLIACI